MKVWAHRGYSGLYPENTMLAFRKAEEAGAYGVELDVHLSSDGELVVIHDESLLRTCGIDKRVEECSLKELVSFDANVLQPEHEAKIPSFEEFCAFLSTSRMHVNIEIKSGVTWYRDIEKKTLDMVRAFGLEEKVLFSSFNWLSIAKCKELAPEIPAGLLFVKLLDVEHLAYGAASLGIDYLHPEFALVDDAMLRETKATGVGINAWTINEREDMEKAREMGLAGVITNYPEKALACLA